jgi:hypothetical protein
VFGVVAGLALVLVGLVASQNRSALIVLSVIGFVLVVGSCGYGVQILRGRGRLGGTATNTGGTASRGPRPTGGLKSRMEERLRRRFDENQS